MLMCSCEKVDFNITSPTVARLVFEAEQDNRNGGNSSNGSIEALLRTDSPRTGVHALGPGATVCVIEIDNRRTASLQEVYVTPRFPPANSEDLVLSPPAELTRFPGPNEPRCWGREREDTFPSRKLKRTSPPAPHGRGTVGWHPSLWELALSDTHRPNGEPFPSSERAKCDTASLLNAAWKDGRWEKRTIDDKKWERRFRRLWPSPAALAGELKAEPVYLY
ncbi:hypothetical protein COCON_G00002460 [Conger conger]|uniref:Uncharacterized protein n=1 Tax=Conger conger TaxID=82655 RepID=A0A9Q1E0X1_CONCO|nr:hypothetical protein COCON_G00002460 [Conger conger]